MVCIPVAIAYFIGVVALIGVGASGFMVWMLFQMASVWSRSDTDFDPKDFDE